ncbi:LysR family transcriptional regulator [Dictyobacter kobayashii]|uniref:LysR family transcriptional regulator n=1 Tax=Dictyobacter kobayashii TaxID=2014872 RepID=UPI000F817261|nr:LysR family transcriptional regulator [Dictyobacter kobayashii]
MVNDLLNAFIQVIDSGSFSKAAEKLYISSTALMKQMNVLEARIGVQLLIRTNHGIRATDAGNSFYHDAKFLTQYSEKAIIRARQAANKNPHLIRIGNSLLNPCKELLDVWNTISHTYPQFKMKIVPLDDDAASWPTVYRTIGKDFDVMVGAYERANESDSFQALKLGEYRFCVAVSREHPLARKERLSVTDLYGERLAMVKPGTSPLIDEIRGYLLTEHQEIQIKGVSHQYDIGLFNRCEENGAVLLTIDRWKDVHPSLVTIPIDWAYTIPYGMLYPLKPSNSVQHFLSALQENIVGSSKIPGGPNRSLNSPESVRSFGNYGTVTS